MGLLVLKTPDDGYEPDTAILARMVALRAALASCKVRLYKSDLSPGPGTALAAYDAAQADFSGYTEDGITVAAVGEPYADATGNYALTVPSVQFNHSGGSTPIVNEIGGAYIVDATGALRAAFRFDESVSMANDLDSLVLSLTIRS